MASDTVYDVVVVGGGIGGFTFGRACALKSLRTIVLERDESEFARTQGYGIGIRQDGIYALAKIRMLPVFRKLVTPRNDSYFLTTAYDGTPLVTMCMKAASIPMDDGAAEPLAASTLTRSDDVEKHVAEAQESVRSRGAVSIDRGCLRTMLQRGAHVAGAEIMWGATFASYREDADADCMVVELKDGRTVRGRVVVGADGVRSRVRAQLVRDNLMYHNVARYGGRVLPSAAPAILRAMLALAHSNGQPVNKHSSWVVTGTGCCVFVGIRPGYSRSKMLQDPDVWRPLVLPGEPAAPGLAPSAHGMMPVPEDDLAQVAEGEDVSVGWGFNYVPECFPELGHTNPPPDYRTNAMDTAEARAAFLPLLLSVMERNGFHEVFRNMVAATNVDTLHCSYMLTRPMFAESVIPNNLDEVIPKAHEAEAAHVTAGGDASPVPPPSLPASGVRRVTLLGDAAHPMTPFAGQGANQALTDAVELADQLHRVLRSGSAASEAGTGAAAVDAPPASGPAIHAALREYERVMLQRSFPLVVASVKNMAFFNIRNSWLVAGRHFLMRVAGWVWRPSRHADLELPTPEDPSDVVQTFN